MEHSFSTYIPGTHVVGFVYLLMGASLQAITDQRKQKKQQQQTMGNKTNKYTNNGKKNNNSNLHYLHSQHNVAHPEYSVGVAIITTLLYFSGDRPHAETEVGFEPMTLLPTLGYDH